MYLLKEAVIPDFGVVSRTSYIIGCTFIATSADQVIVASKGSVQT